MPRLETGYRQINIRVAEHARLDALRRDMKADIGQEVTWTAALRRLLDRYDETNAATAQAVGR